MPSSSPALADPLAGSFDRAAVEYESGRPGWPAAAVEVPARELGLAPAASVCDLAAGTGKLTRLLVERFDTVVAVEPLDALRELLATFVPAADARSGSAESLPLENESLDAIFVAEAFHWFDGARALAEGARVLRPGGGLVLMWNRPAAATEPALPDELKEEVNRRFRQSKHPLEDFDSGEWRAAFTGAPFAPLRQAGFEHAQRLDRGQLLAWFASVSWIATLPQGERDELLGRIASWLDADAYVRRWRADVYWTARI